MQNSLLRGRGNQVRWQSTLSPCSFLRNVQIVFIRLLKFFSSSLKVFVTKLVTLVTKFVICVTKFVICVTKFVICVSKFVTNFSCVDNEKYHGLRKKILQANKKSLIESRALLR